MTRLARSIQNSSPTRARRKAAPEAAARRASSQDETRDRIIAASIKFMTAHGSQRLSLVDVARLADVARATVYNYFGSKEALIEAAEYSMDMEFFRGLTDSVRDAKTLDAQVGRMAAFIRKCWTDRDHTPWYGFLSPLDEAVLVVSHSAEHYRRLSEFVQPLVDDAVKRGEVREDLDTTRASDWIARLVLSFALDPADPELDKPDNIDRLFRDFLLNGFRERPA